MHFGLWKLCCCFVANSICSWQCLCHFSLYDFVTNTLHCYKCSLHFHSPCNITHHHVAILYRMCDIWYHGKRLLPCTLHVSACCIAKHKTHTSMNVAMSLKWWELRLNSPRIEFGFVQRIVKQRYKNINQIFQVDIIFLILLICWYLFQWKFEPEETTCKKNQQCMRHFAWWAYQFHSASLSNYFACKLNENRC